MKPTMASAACMVSEVEGAVDSPRGDSGHRRNLLRARELNAIIRDFLGEEDDRLDARSNVGGEMLGMGLIVKDCFDVRGVPTTVGSKFMAEGIPAAETSVAVQAFVDLGCKIFAKTNLQEFCWGVTGQNPHWGDVGNPRYPGHVSGGSSSGNAAALAVGFGDIALGTDTGGSVRIPSACCGIVGYKPARGRISANGTFPLSPTLDTPGLMGRSVTEVVFAMSKLTGDEFPPVSLADLEIGVLEPGPQQRLVEEAGARTSPVSLDFPEDDVTAIFMREAFETHSLHLNAHWDDYGADFRERMSAAMLVSVEDAERSRKTLAEWRHNVDQHVNVDVVISPTLGSPVPRVGVWEPSVRKAFGHWTRPYNFLDWPAIAVGNMQIAGRDERTVLGAALALGIEPMEPALER